MDFSKLASLSVGLAAFIGGLWIVLQILRAYKRNGHGQHYDKAGERSTDEWEGRMRKMHEESEQRIMQDMRQLMHSRNEELRRIIREELSNK